MTSIEFMEGVSSAPPAIRRECRLVSNLGGAHQGISSGNGGRTDPTKRASLAPTRWKLARA
jgi:hypothetical protein